MNTFGQLFRLTDFGETHGECIGGVIDGCPAGIYIDIDFIQSELDRRAPSQDTTSTTRRERDKVRFVAGIFDEKSTGAPIAFLIDNADAVVNEANEHVLKPSHASYVLKEKFGHTCNEQGGRFSGRQTACRVVGGAIAKLILRSQGIDIQAEPIHIAPLTEFDTSGALVKCTVTGMPTGIGEPAYDGLDARLAAAMLSIPSCKGFDLGAGFQAAEMHGSEYNDVQNADFTFCSNHDGGIQAGISNGEPVVFRVAFKPIPTLPSDQQTIDYAGNPAIYHGSSRNDRCVVPRVLPVVEAMTALVLVDAIMQNSAHFSK